jgi:hypothetical protein
MDEIVQTLSQGDHKVVVGGPQPSVRDFRTQLENKFVTLKFGEPSGGVEVGVSVDEAATAFEQVDWDASTGNVHVEGAVMLNGEQARCVADIALNTLNGTGHLEV